MSAHASQAAARGGGGRVTERRATRSDRLCVAIIGLAVLCCRCSRGRAGRSHERAAEEEEDKELVNDELQQAEVKKSWSVHATQNSNERGR